VIFIEKKTKIWIVSLIIVLGIIGTLWVWYVFSLQNSCDFNTLQGRQIYNLIEQANYCTANSDCVISREFQCFGCYNLFNKDADLTKIRTNIQKHYSGCACMPKCRLLSQEEVVCENNKCVKRA